MRKIFLQIGASRDGQNPYSAVAKREGYFTVLAETADVVDHLSLPFDLILRLDRPEQPWEVMQAYLAAGLLEPPRVVVAGFDACNASAGRVRAMLASPTAGHDFVPLDKYAQRMALKKACARFPQPEFRFFASPLSILAARDALLYPCVIKPVDGGGGRGIWLLQRASQLDQVIARLMETVNDGGRRFSGFIVECWLPGDEYSLQGIVHNGRALALTCCQKVIEQHSDGDGGISFYEAGHVAVAAHALPAPFASLMAFCCETFAYHQGAFHIDFIVVDGVPHFLEMGFRLSGMGVVNLVQEATGINWAELAFSVEAGLRLPPLRFTHEMRAVGQLRLRQPAQLLRAQRWIEQHQCGSLLPRSAPNNDLTRHAAMLSTFHLTAAARDDVLAVFQQIIQAHPVIRRRNLLCAE
ncbi:ATP-grasp domain-containing protein [[Erwinia] mediterraneensis]|uniref:ATP-grasp domain-containing protein n=1 Tax=[Erwinia] mediterraneensis TaxID=2161819 RepID=UPI00102FD8CD|nr:ATP-grasp domain-containing protein [[Erwinia] mediterraneensis]